MDVPLGQISDPHPGGQSTQVGNWPGVEDRKPWTLDRGIDEHKGRPLVCTPTRDSLNVRSYISNVYLDRDNLLFCALQLH